MNIIYKDRKEKSLFVILDNYKFNIENVNYLQQNLTSYSDLGVNHIGEVRIFLGGGGEGDH